MTFTGMDLFESAVSFIIGIVGGYLLRRGHKTGDSGQMLWGGILLLVSTWMFW
ncbi:MAG: hypothetical protein ACREL1_04545 [bacterium]